jgi:hypothetical protein
MWDGQGLKDPCIFLNFFYNHKIIKKSLFYETEIGFIERGSGIFMNFLTLFDNLRALKGQCHEFVASGFFMYQFPPAPAYPANF